MRKWGALAIGGVLLISPATHVNAAAPKAGATCTKKNATATSAGKLYTCILSGKKLVWNKGVAVKVSPSPTPKSEPINLLASDSRITSLGALTDLDVCKTEDASPEYLADGTLAHHNGFPRPINAFSGKKSAKVLVVPLSFNDLPFRSEKVQRANGNYSDLDLVKASISGTIARYKTLSNQKFNLTIDVLPQSKWIVLNADNPFDSKWGLNRFPELMEIVDNSNIDFNFDNYDSIIFLTGNGNPGQKNLGAAQASFAEKTKLAKSGFISAVFLLGSIDNVGIWVHELGHSLFSLEDLYLYSDAASRLQRDKVGAVSIPVKWDLMAEAPKETYLQWNRLLMGWLDDADIRCINDQKNTIHYLTDSIQTRNPKLLTINLSPGVTLAAEVRDSSDSEKGLLLYLIDTYISNGEGPILTQNSLVTIGGSLSWLGWKISVLDSNQNGLLVEVVKTDVDKYVPPDTKPSPNKQGSQSTTIKVTRGDIVPNGYLKGKATWTVTGHESYRLYVTAADDFQKVYFETGVVNDSRNPLEIEITGLPCNKDLRTMTEFYSKKNGEGERVVMESRQLTRLSCEDTAKKP
jgi:M6 family metalloprotease-like protein